MLRPSLDVSVVIAKTALGRIEMIRENNMLANGRTDRRKGREGIRIPKESYMSERGKMGKCTVTAFLITRMEMSIKVSSKITPIMASGACTSLMETRMKVNMPSENEMAMVR